MKIYTFGRAEVVTAAGTEDGKPVLLLAHASDFGGIKPTKEEMIAHPDTLKLVFASAEGALVIPMAVMQAVEATADALGIDAETLKLPVVMKADYEKVVADFETLAADYEAFQAAQKRRVQDLLESNNALLERARNAGAKVAELQAEIEEFWSK